MLTLKRLALIVLIVAIVDIVFMSFTFFTQILREPSKSLPISRQKSDNFSDTHDNYRNDPEWIVNTNHLSPKNERLKDESITANRILPTVEIWSKAAIGHYLWQHILKGKSTKQTQFYHYGSKKFPDMEIKFRSGPSLMPQSLERFLSKNVDEFGRKHHYPTNIILVLNGRSQEKIDFAKTWLNCLKKLHQTEYDVAFNSGAIILGHEFCFNSWIKPYLASNGGPLKFLFVVYDWADVNDQEIFQWPLGVATYRDFPAFDPNRLNFDFPRPYACNFLGTVYPNSSREELLRVINKTSDVKCYTRPRFKWEPSESRETLNLYMQALRLSDLTLSPIGMNHECYRIYEALTFGSVPVIEHNINHVLGKKSHCDQNSAYRLLKRYDAPFIYVQNWTTDLTSILRRELELSPEAKVQRRIKVVKWYTDFQDKLRDHLFSVISNKFRF